MNLERLYNEFSNVVILVIHLRLKKKFSVSELIDISSIPPSTLYRYIQEWRDEGHIKKRKRKEYIVTKKGLNFFTEYLNKVSNIVELISSNAFEI